MPDVPSPEDVESAAQGVLDAWGHYIDDDVVDPVADAMGKLSAALSALPQSQPWERGIAFGGRFPIEWGPSDEAWAEAAEDQRVWRPRGAAPAPQREPETESTATDVARRVLTEAGRPDIAERLEPNRAGHPKLGQLRGLPDVDLALAYMACTLGHAAVGTPLIRRSQPLPYGEDRAWHWDATVGEIRNTASVPAPSIPLREDGPETATKWRRATVTSHGDTK